MSAAAALATVSGAVAVRATVLVMGAAVLVVRAAVVAVRDRWASALAMPGRAAAVRIPAPGT
jgi:hypothetical protein